MPKLFNSFEIQICDNQGRLFEHSIIKKLDSEDFIKKFMNSKTCESFDMSYDQPHCIGEEHIMRHLMKEVQIKPQGKNYGNEVLYWTGYVYRYWNILTGESSRDIYMQANAKRMEECYLGFHTFDVVMAIEDLKEIHRQHNSN